MKKTVGILALICSAYLPQTTMAASHVLPEGAVICDSAEKYEEQLDRIASRNYSVVPGCGMNKSSITVELVDFSALGATKVYVPSIGAYIYVDGSDLR